MPRQVVTPSPLVRGHPVNDGLLAWWCHLPPSDGGAFVYDRAEPLLLHGACTNSGPSVQGALPRPGALGPPMSFGGGTQRLTMASGHERLFDGQFTFTIAFWFMARSFANSPILYSHGVNNTNFFAELKTSGDGLYWGSGGGGSFRTYSGWGLAANTWYHVTLVREGDGDDGNVYLNGAVNMSYTGVINNIADDGERDLWLGNYNDTGLGLDGAIDDFRVYRRAFTAAQVAALYDESRNGYPNAVRRFWSAMHAAPAAEPPPTSSFTLVVGATATATVTPSAASALVLTMSATGTVTGAAPPSGESEAGEAAPSLVLTAQASGSVTRGGWAAPAKEILTSGRTGLSLDGSLEAAWNMDEAPGFPRVDSFGASDLASCFPGDSSAHPIYLGSGTAGHAWNGAMARFFRYSRLLTSGERASVYNAGAGVKFSDVSGGSLGDALFWYDLDEATGTGDRADATGRNTGLEASASLSRVTGPDGASSAVQFAGGNYLYHADSADFRTTGREDWAIGLWVNADTIDESGPVDYFAGKALADNVEWLFYYARQAARSRWQIDLGYATTDPELATVKADAAGKPNAGQWYFLLMEMDASTNTLYLRVDNTYVDSLQPTVVPHRVSGLAGAQYATRFIESEAFNSTTVPTARPAAKFVSCASPGTAGDPLRGGDRDWTMAGWFKLNSLVASPQRIVGKMAETGTALDYQLSWFSSNGGRLYGEVSDGGGSNFASAFVALADTDEHFFVFSYNSSTNTVSVALDNGTPGTAVAGFTPTATAHDFCIGCSSDESYARQFVGDIGPLWRWGRLLTAYEQAVLFDAGGAARPQSPRELSGPEASLFLSGLTSPLLQLNTSSTGRSASAGSSSPALVLSAGPGGRVSWAGLSLFPTQLLSQATGRTSLASFAAPALSLSCASRGSLLLPGSSLCGAALTALSGASLTLGGVGASALSLSLSGLANLGLAGASPPYVQLLFGADAGDSGGADLHQGAAAVALQLAMQAQAAVLLGGLSAGELALLASGSPSLTRGGWAAPSLHLLTSAPPSLVRGGLASPSMTLSWGAGARLGAAGRASPLAQLLFAADAGGGGGEEHQGGSSLTLELALAAEASLLRGGAAAPLLQLAALASPLVVRGGVAAGGVSLTAGAGGRLVVKARGPAGLALAMQAAATLAGGEAPASYADFIVYLTVEGDWEVYLT